MSEQKIVWKGKRTLVTDDGGVVSFYVLRQDPAGNSYFQYEGGGGDGSGGPSRGVAFFLRALTEDLQEKQ